MLRTVSIDTGKAMRVICNPHANFTERMKATGNPVRANDESRPIIPVERAINGAGTHHHRCLCGPKSAS